MAQYRARVEVTGTQPGRHTFYPAEETIRLGLTFGVDPAGGAGLVAQMPTLTDTDIVAVELMIDDGAGGAIRLVSGGRTAGNANQTPDRWFFAEALGNDYYDNAEACWRNEIAFAPPGQILPIPGVVIGGAALAAVVAPPDPTDAVISYRPRFSTPGASLSPTAVFSEMQLAMFVDDAAGENPADLSTFLRRVEGVMSGAGGVHTTPSGERLNRCSFAAVDPRFGVWIRAGDIGNGTDQIPATVASNTAAAYSNHPAVFFTAPTARNQRAFEVVNVNTNAITTFAGSVPVITVDSAPIASRWIFVIDGCPIEVVLAHPTGSDYRRPREIWNSVVVPLITTPAVGQGPIFYADEVSGGNRTLHALGVLQDLRRLEYAAFVEPLGPTDADITTVYYQS